MEVLILLPPLSKYWGCMHESPPSGFLCFETVPGLMHALSAVLCPQVNTEEALGPESSWIFLTLFIALLTLPDSPVQLALV